MGWECFCEVGFDLGPLLQGQTRILHLQYFFKYVLAYFLHLNNYLVTFLHNPICGAQLICPSVSFGISFEHAVQLPFTVLLYSTFPDNYAFLSLSPSQIKNTHSADTVPVHGHSTLVLYHRVLISSFASFLSLGSFGSLLLRFLLLGWVYQFVVMPLGLATGL